jgi:hypothetical protein
MSSSRTSTGRLLGLLSAFEHRIERTERGLHAELAQVVSHPLVPDGGAQSTPWRAMRS